jgi:hypothetical protein
MADGATPSTPPPAGKSWWSGRSEKFKQTVVVALIGAIPGTIAGTAGLLKKNDEKTAREVYGVLIKIVEHLSNENDITQRNLEATHASVRDLSEKLDELGKRVERESASSLPLVASAPVPPLLPSTKGGRIRVTASRKPAPPPAPPSSAAFTKSDVMEFPANWPEE